MGRLHADGAARDGLVASALALLVAAGVLLWVFGAPASALAQPSGGELPPAAHRALFEAQQVAAGGDDARALNLLRAYREDAGSRGEEVPAMVFLAEGAALYRLDRMAPGDADLRLNLGLALYADGRPAEAAGAFGEAFRRYRDQGELRPELLYQAAAGYHQAGDTPGARRSLAELWALGQALNSVQVPDTWHELWVQVLCDGGEWAEAERAVDRLLRTRREDRRLWTILAQVRANAGRYAAAASALEIADAAAPLERGDLLLLADLHGAAGAPLRAAAILERAARLEKDPGLHDKLAALYLEARRFDEAEEHARRALALHVDGARLLALGRILSQAGRHEALEALCREHSGTDARNGELLLLATAAAVERGSWASADELLRRAASDRSVTTRVRAWRGVLENLERARRESLAAGAS
jgi:tetratricopeptide (TPR) repeat protein